MASHGRDTATTRRQRGVLVALVALAIGAGAAGWLLIDHSRTAAIEATLRRDIDVVRPRIADARAARRRALTSQAIAAATPGDAPCRARHFGKIRYEITAPGAPLGEGLVEPASTLERAEGALARHDEQQADLAHVAELKTGPLPDELFVVGDEAYVYGYAEGAIVCAAHLDGGAAGRAADAIAPSLRAVRR